MLQRYALRVCERIDALAVTHLDALPAFDQYRYAHAYSDRDRLEPPQTLPEQEELGRLLLNTTPRYREVGRVTARDWCATLSEQLGTPLALGASGPTAAQVFAPFEQEGL